MTGTVLLTQTEAARVLRCHPITVLRLRRAGKLRAMAGTPVRILESELRRYIEQALVAGEAGLGRGAGSKVIAKDRTVVAAKARAARQERMRKSLLTIAMRGMR